ncbi:MAG: glycoside hydrolase N-terminal domain-containing protein, partial [Verrucomicrobia subdivision 3 bacterium]|nr:glycoside hydrolase N-terminal domain-containing protein [Limisphaerales bacterium]
MKTNFHIPSHCILFAGLVFAGSATAVSLPDASLNVKLAAPIRTWDEAVPLGNGLLGGLLWGETNLLRLSLDRGDLWDLRTPPEIHEPGFTFQNMAKLARERNQKEIGRLFDEPYNQPTPTKIPAGRLEILLDPTQSVERFELNLATAEGRAELGSGQQCEAFFSATKPVALLRITGPEPKEIRLRLPGSGGGDTGPSSHAVAKLGYPAARMGSDGRAHWFIQATAGPLKYCVFVESRRAGEATLVAATVTASSADQDVLREARRLVSAALRQGYAAALRPHAAWWAKFWAQSAVTIPELDIQRHYYLVRYFYGATSRRGAPPMPLQGVWTADAGSLPPWKGDYHNDLNTQMSYMGYQGAGHFEEGSSFLDFNWELLPAYRRFARDFYGTDGANVPGVMSLAGDPLTGWGQYSLSPTMGPWIAHLFYLHWRYTGDERFLQTRAYPWCRELGICLQGLLKADEQGVLVLPLSSSPEIHDNRLSAWLKPNSNYDLACLKMLFVALGEMADACGKPGEAQAWRATARGLGDWHVNADGALKLDANEDLAESHRHLSNLMGLYPFDLITVEDGARERQIIRASLDQWDKLGTKQWCGYSFT